MSGFFRAVEVWVTGETALYDEKSGERYILVQRVEGGMPIRVHAFEHDGEFRYGPFLLQVEVDDGGREE